jgi:drug/metabolite transporter (DMT)-like permease
MAEFEGAGGTALAYAALLAAAFCFAANAVIASRMPEMPASVATSGVLIAAAAVTVPVALAFSGFDGKPLTLDAIGSMAVLALLITPGATYAYFRLVAVAGPTFLSLFNYFNPLIAVTCGVLVLDEKIGAEAVIALALILAGVAIAELQRRPADSGMRLARKTPA